MNFVRRWIRKPLLRAIAFTASGVLAGGWARAQQGTNPPAKPAPAKLAPHVLLMTDSVVTEQWPHTLKLVNAPNNLSLVTPGECIRIGIYATGDGRDEYIEKTHLSFTVKFAGKSQALPAAPLAAFKQIKPEGSDLVAAALAAGRAKNPLPAFATMGASADKWCVPANAQDGTATVTAQAKLPDGLVKLPAAKLQVESFATGAQRKFTDAKDFTDFSMGYYREPDATRLVPLLEYLAGDNSLNSNPATLQIFVAFLSAALKADPVAAKDFQTRISAEPIPAQSLALAILRSAGYDVSDAERKLSADAQQQLKAVTPLSDLFNVPTERVNATYLDMMWAVFGAIGSIAPIEKVAGALIWRAEYEAFDKLRKSGKRLTQADLTPSIMHGLIYVAAGWSMSSFQVNDPLAADYIEYMLAAPDVSDTVKAELKDLQTNPAFRERGADAK